MTASPEQIGSHQEEPDTLETTRPGVTVNPLSEADLPALKKMFDRNKDHFERGGIWTDLYTTIEEEVTTGDHADTRHRMAIRNNGKLAGYIGAVFSEDPSKAHEVQIAYALDMLHAERGIATAAVRAVVEHENEKGNTVVADVEPENGRSKKLLGRLGFKASALHDEHGREVFVHPPQN